MSGIGMHAPEDENVPAVVILPIYSFPMANQALLDPGDKWHDQRTNWRVFSIVRMKDGVTQPQVQAELNTIATRMKQQYPTEEDKLGFKLTRPGLIGDFLGAPARGFLAGVMGLASIVLLAACANLGSLFAARTADRTRNRHSHRYRIQPRAHSPPGTHRGACHFHLRRPMRLPIVLDRPAGFGFLAPTY